jgi:hypothetical protein
MEAPALPLLSATRRRTPISAALATSTTEPRSLNESVGIKKSSFSRRPSSMATRGVAPSPIVTSCQPVAEAENGRAVR